MSDSTTAPPAPTISDLPTPSPAVTSIHAAIRRGSVLKAAPKPASEGVLPQSAVQAYTQRVEAGKNEQSVLAELSAKRGSISLKPTSGPVDNSARSAKEAYLREQDEEAELLTANSKILRELRTQHEELPPPPPPSPPPAEAEESIPPPPATAAPADFLSQISSAPKIKLNLQPVHQQKLSGGDGVNPALLALSAIEKKDLKSTLKPVRTEIKDHFQSDEYKEQAKEDEIELNKTLRRNSVLMDALRVSGPPPSYPESEEDLKEAQEAKEAEQKALGVLETIEEGVAMPASAAVPASRDMTNVDLNKPQAPRVELVRRNSKLTYLGDLTKPLARLQLNPVASLVAPPSSVDEEEEKEREHHLRFTKFAHRPSATTGVEGSQDVHAPAKYMIGLMSGTSLDGVDGVLAEFAPEPSDAAQHQVRSLASKKSPFNGLLGRVLSHAFIPMPSGLRATLHALNKNTFTGQELTHLVEQGGEIHLAELAKVELAKIYAKVVEKLLEKSSVPSSLVLAIASHGQTIRHRPELGYTVQLSNPALLAELTGIPVISDFRTRDVAAGGTGAPLVPKFHEAWFGAALSAGAGSGMKNKSASSTTANSGMVILNLGGIANITHISPSHASSHNTKKPVLGFDTGPANVLSDLWISQCKPGVEFDRDGAWAKGGKVIQPLLEQFLKEPYFALEPPKSTGRDFFHQQWLLEQIEAAGVVAGNAKQEDIAATILELTAVSVAQAVQKYCDAAENGEAGASSPTAASSSSSSSTSRSPVFACGGGALNSYLLSRLRHHLPGRTVEPTSAHGLEPETVEAMAFAWIGWEFLQGRTTNLPRVTGAKGPRMLGAYYPA